MSMQHLGWKVLRIDPDTGLRTSTFAITGALSYPKGWRRTPLPGCGPITLFETYHSAKRFSGLLNHDVVEIVPVKYEPWDIDADLDYSLWQPVEGGSIRGMDVSRYISEKRTVTLNRVVTGVRRKKELPAGTVLASAVTCLE